MVDVTSDAVEGIILKSLQSLNEEFDDEKKIKIDISTPLFGMDSQIDSLSLVSLIVDIETLLNTEYNLSISLTDDRAMSRAESPFLSALTLKNYILELASEA